jgi:ribosomal protein S18 acetylase RimI-like enzyme
MTLSISLEADPRRKRQLQEQITARLPEWFGQRAANLAYAAQAERLPGYVATVDGAPKGLLLLKTHSEISAEILWLGVDRECHRSGIGRALVEAACDASQADGARLLFVRTLHPRVAYEPYQRTRRFYEAVGFRYVLEEAWPDPDNPIALYLRSLG